MVYIDKIIAVVYILERVILVNKLDKKGFSLVELIGVIALLGLIIVIATTSGLGAFNNAKDRLKEEDEKTFIAPSLYDFFVNGIGVNNFIEL